MSLFLDIRVGVGTFSLQVSFDAPAGIVALYGPSGAGKTMTLRCIAGLMRPSDGRIVLEGRPIFDRAEGIDVPTRQRRIGYVFQQYALLPHLSVAGNVGYGLHHGARDERLSRVDELLRLMGLEGYGDRSIVGLSGGEQQRVALARALAPQPVLLLLDEPFAALDTRVRRRLRDELRRVHAATGVPMVLVTHDLTEVRQLADWLVVYGGGRVLGSGRTEEVLTDPGSREAAEVLYGEKDG